MSEKLVYKKWFKVLIVCIMFLPLVTETGYDPQNTTKVIAEVLKNPLINQVRWVLPIAKAILLFAAVSPFVLKRHSEKPLLSLYAALLLMMGIFQNMAQTQYGFTFIPGNFVVQYLVMGFCMHDLIKGKTRLSEEDFDKTKLWILPLMLLAFLMPYTIDDSWIIVPSLKNILVNEAGVTYCMVTPVVTGVLILFHKSVHKPTLNIISFLGLGFGILNMMTWFIFDIQNWWMGILHLPLLTVSIYGLWISGRKKEGEEMSKRQV